MATMDINLVKREVLGMVSSGETSFNSRVLPQYPTCLPLITVAVILNEAANCSPLFLTKVVSVE